ncbi:hypothetical protein VOLCADRAFT_96266 [Volvox carteri f. nagariensis]|uniref:Uncharacterized protein n=1 Tax=Volvox carteri f. nagariensis TaxID=3068 RepID=D8U9N4_VOLCA|nr:uncharacterized protein VOLCADRAFT_96266 [Volvox carteri f. nagariensis]EFJ43672.1 hypothetical protein VOLCADRAFT_96266 [Volvox carteri f. nagariensis]|eukprot:XP_002955372.1 hypothetical protein VOLCADRAFT_96266 [Volvox carteri f. nagariensis]
MVVSSHGWGALLRGGMPHPPKTTIQLPTKGPTLVATAWRAATKRAVTASNPGAAAATAITTPPHLDLSFRTPKRPTTAITSTHSVSSSEDPPTPRLTWLSYLSPNPVGRAAGSGKTASRGPSRGGATVRDGYTSVTGRRGRRGSSSGGGSGGRGSDRSSSRGSRSRSRTKRSESFGGGGSEAVAYGRRLNSSAAPQQQRRRTFEGATAAAATAATSGSAARVRPISVSARPGTGPLLLHAGPPLATGRLKSDISTNTDADSEREEEAVVQQMLGGTAAWLQERQLERQRQQDLAELRRAARRRARAAVAGTAEVLRGGGGGGGYDSDSRSSRGTVRSNGTLSADSRCGDDGLDVGASFTSWVGNRRAINGSHVGRAGGAAALGIGVSRPRSPPPPLVLLRTQNAATVLAAAQRRHLLSRSSGGAVVRRAARCAMRTALSAREGGGGGKSNSNSTVAAAAVLRRALLWRDAEVLVASETGRLRGLGGGGCGRGQLLLPAAGTRKALSDSSEDSFAYRVTSAAMTLRSMSVPRYSAGRRHDIAWQRQRQAHQRLGGSIAAGYSLSRDESRSAGRGARRASPTAAAAAAAFRSAADVASAAVSRATSVISSGSSGDGSGSTGKPRTWFMTEVLRTPVGSHLSDREEPQTHGSQWGRRGGGRDGGGAGSGSCPSSPVTWSPPWIQSPSQKLSLSRVWGPMYPLESKSPRSSYEGGGGGGSGKGGGRGEGEEGFHGGAGGGGAQHGADGYAASDDALWRSPSRPPPSRPPAGKSHSVLRVEHGPSALVMHCGDDPSVGEVHEAEERRSVSRPHSKVVRALSCHKVIVKVLLWRCRSGGGLADVSKLHA